MCEKVWMISRWTSPVKGKMSSCRESSSLGKREWGWQGCQWQHLGSFIPSFLQWEYSPHAKASINNRHNYPVSSPLSSQLFKLQSGKHRRRTLTGCVWLRYLHVVQILPPPSPRQCCNVAQTGHWPFHLVEPWLRGWFGCFPGGAMVKKLPANARDIWDASSIPEYGWSPGGVYDNPLQYSCLGNSMDRGAWQATVHGITQSRTLMRWLSKHGAQHCGVSVGSEDALWFIVLPESSKN